MSIAREGLQPPGTTNILTPSSAVPCLETISLNLPTALSEILTMLPPCCIVDATHPEVQSLGIEHITSLLLSAQLFFSHKTTFDYSGLMPQINLGRKTYRSKVQKACVACQESILFCFSISISSSILTLISSRALLKSFIISSAVPIALIGSSIGQ
jgi:hypothetical protein